MKVYCAGPLFTPYHRAFTARNAKRLREAGIICYVPHERGVISRSDAAAGRPVTAEDIFDTDYEMVNGVNAIVALLDDADVSSGTACEVGIFYGLMQADPLKKGILGLLTDARGERRKRAGVNPINGFLLGCIEKAGKVCSSIEEVIEQLLVWSEELKKEESGRKR